jgi:hypothetical protein
VAGALATTVAWLYQAFAICVLFREVRRRKEAQDIEAAIDELVASAGGGSAAADAPQAPP